MPEELVELLSTVSDSYYMVNRNSFFSIIISENKKIIKKNLCYHNCMVIAIHTMVGSHFVHRNLNSTFAWEKGEKWD